MAEIPEDADILPPSDDRIFKVLLTHPDAKPVLISVISTAIDQPVIDVQVRNTELPATDINEKAQRFDVNCTIDGGVQVNVEMQCSPVEEDTKNDHRCFFNKSVYYLTDLHSSQKSKSVPYGDLARSFQVTFCGYNVLPGHPDFVHRISLRRDTGEQISDQINMVVVEMDKLRGHLNKPAESLTPLEMWSAFFKFAEQGEYRKVINNIINIKEEIGMASTLLMEISKDEHERALFLSRKKAEMDRVSDLITVERRGRMEGIALGEARGRTEGRAEGMALGEARGRTEGRAEGRAETIDEVFALLDTGLPIAEIKKMLER